MSYSQTCEKCEPGQAEKIGRELVEVRAYHIWLERDCPSGQDEEIWLLAEKQVYHEKICNNDKPKKVTRKTKTEALSEEEPPKKKRKKKKKNTKTVLKTKKKTVD